MSTKHPLYASLSKRSVSLTAEEQETATKDMRIRSVLPYLMTRAWDFALSLTPGQRANMDAEDVLSDLYCEMEEKDDKWKPEVGKYMTYVRMLIDHKLAGMIDHSTTVHSPRNSGSRLDEYERAKEQGTLKAGPLATANAILGARQGVISATPDHDPAATHLAADEEVYRTEQLMAAKKAIIEGIAELNPYEAAVVGSYFGLWGQPPKRVCDIAAHYNMGDTEVRRLIKKSKDKMCEQLAGMESPF